MRECLGRGEQLVALAVRKRHRGRRGLGQGQDHVQVGDQPRRGSSGFQERPVGQAGGPLGLGGQRVERRRRDRLGPLLAPWP